MSMYPHQCPECTAAAYIGGDQLVRCTNEDCIHVDPDLDIGSLEHDGEPGLSMLDELELCEDWDEDTLPQMHHKNWKISWPV